MAAFAMAHSDTLNIQLDIIQVDVDKVDFEPLALGGFYQSPVFPTG